ncbi:MAG: RNA methyltransferase [Bacilli bacterium]|nr:RNA methyltransferase [Bacilli bacterium]
MLYSSIDNKKIKEIKKLNLKKYRDKTNLFLVEGEHLVMEAYKSGYLKELILEQDNDLNLDITTNYVTNNVLKYITNLDTPQSILGICSKTQNDTIKGNRLLILDDIQDPGNLGTIIRSAVAFNVDTIILSFNTVDLYNSKVIRASQGLIFYINIIVMDLTTTIPKLKNEGYQIIGTKVTDGKSLKSIEKKKKFAIIMGNEGNGVREDILSLCDEYLYIDMNKNCESLNVGVATSIILYELDK